MTDKCNKRIIALGYFDCVHMAHRQILSEAKSLAQKKGMTSAAVTFSDNVKSSRIYDLKERVALIRKFVDDIILLEFNEKFKNTEPERYLDMLQNEYGAGGFVCGFDHKFGRNAAGNCDFLRSYCKKNGLYFVEVDKLSIDGEVVSATRIKGLLQNGNIEEANKLLVTPYHISDVVIKGRGEGHIFGFPTVNFEPKTGKILPKSGVYSTMTDIVLGKYKSVTNIGIKPTFNDSNTSIETFIGDGFNADIYGKEITIYFNKYLRDIKKFPDPEHLKEQIYKDIRS